MGFPGKSPVRCAVTMVRSPAASVPSTSAWYRYLRRVSCAQSRMALHPRISRRSSRTRASSAKQAATRSASSVLAAAKYSVMTFGSSTTTPILGAAARAQIQRDIRPSDSGRAQRRKAHLVAGLRLENHDDLVGFWIDQLALAPARDDQLAVDDDARVGHGACHGLVPAHPFDRRAHFEERPLTAAAGAALPTDRKQ